MINGFAFSEEKDMKALGDYAQKGWLLEGISSGLFYKLRKGEPENLVYSLDYQEDDNEEYYSLFREAGWKKVLSRGEVHIFSAPAGTKPIYSDNKSERYKYEAMKEKSGRGALYSLLTMILLLLGMMLSIIYFKPIFLLLFALFIIDMVMFVFNLLPYLLYKARLKNKRDSTNRILGITYGFCGIIFFIFALGDALDKNPLGIIALVASILCIKVSVDSFKKEKKSLK